MVKINRSAIKRLWYLNLILLPVFLLYPISYGILRLTIVILLVSAFCGGLFIFWPQKIVRITCLILLVIVASLTLLPGREIIDTSALRQSYVQQLSKYQGSPYVWGGENKIGIDCSGLVRQGLIKANWQQGLLSFNPNLIRKGLSLWWHDTSAVALRDEYKNYTKQLFLSPSINELNHNRIKPGDLAVTADGVHILAYIGNQTWIEADPNYQQVIKVKIPEPNNPWFNVPIYTLQWQQF
ncbi:MAG: NlpC/P60 family protein [Spirulinaceae cyanobacterium]